MTKFIFILLLSWSYVFADDKEFFLLPEISRLAAKKIEGSIVTIENFGGVLDSAIKGDGKFKQVISGFSNPGEGPTTGLILSKDGLVITSTFNFISMPKITTITLNDGRKFHAELLGRDFTRKICLLQIKESVNDLLVPEFISSNDIKVGQYAISLGKGYGGTESAISIGLISGKNRISGRAIQTDANISPVNYGGPLVDLEGKVIGIMTPHSPMDLSAAGGAEWYDSGIGFAIPIKDIPQIIERLKSKEDINYGKIGIYNTMVEEHPEKVMVDLVMPESPAEKAGVKSADFILEINNIKISSLVELKRELQKYESGSQIILTIERSGEITKIPVSLVTGQDLFQNKTVDEVMKK